MDIMKHGKEFRSCEKTTLEIGWQIPEIINESLRIKLNMITHPKVKYKYRV